MNFEGSTRAARPQLFLPSARGAVITGVLAAVALGGALWLRYAVIQNSEIGVACEAGEESFLCTLGLAAILLFARGVFGWVALLAALFHLWRPSTIIFGIGIVFALLGLVLYNTRVAALALPLLVLSLARRASANR